MSGSRVDVRLGRGPGWLRMINRAGVAYLDRYSLRKQGDSGTNAWRVYLHRFWSGDGACLHNHPWRWSLSIVLRGSYVEEYAELGPLGRGPLRMRRVRWLNFIGPSKLHRIVSLSAPGAVWTLFIGGPLTGKGWGFWHGGKIVRYREGENGPC